MTELNPSLAGRSESAELRDELAQLQAQTHNLRIALLIVALSVAGFFWLEARRNGEALETLRPQVAQVAETTKGINDFVSRLAEFARTNPDFNPILTKYGIPPAAAPTAPGLAPAAPKK